MTVLPDYLIEKLEEIADAEKRSPAEVLESMLRQYKKSEETPYATLADLAQNALEAGLRSPEMTDIAESK